MPVILFLDRLTGFGFYSQYFTFFICHDGIDPFVRRLAMLSQFEIFVFSTIVVFPHWQVPTTTAILSVLKMDRRGFNVKREPPKLAPNQIK